MAGTARRGFLKATTAVAASLVGCSDDAPLPARDARGCANPFAGGARGADVPFASEGTPVMETEVGAGLDGRLYTDLARLTPDTVVTANERFYIRTLASELLPATTDLGDWRLEVRGLVESPSSIAVSSLVSLVEPMGVHLMECSGNSEKARFGLLSAASWDGVPMKALLSRARPLANATRVRVSGFDRYPATSTTSTEGASWVFTLEQLSTAFLATRMNGAPLPRHHGFPARLLVPGWYGCTCIKWVNELAFVDDSEPSTAHMREFASRTHQTGTPELAREYRAANIEHAAMPIRIERWIVAGKPLYRVVGILWGGSSITSALEIRFGDEPWVAVDVCPPVTTHRTWTLWSHAWSPRGPGTHRIQVRLADRAIPTRRLDSGYYARNVTIV